MTEFGRGERREIGPDLVRAIADVADDAEAIEPATRAAVELAEDERQRGDLDAAVAMVDVVRANLHRADASTRSRFGSVAPQLEAALEASETIRRYREARRQELDIDLRAAISGQRMIVVGSKRA